MARAQRRDLRMRLRTSYVGPVSVAVLLASVAEELVSAADQPIVALVARLVNSFIRRAAPDTFPIYQPTFIWQSSAAHLMAAIGVAIATFVLASWLYKPTSSES